MVPTVVPLADPPVKVLALSVMPVIVGLGSGCVVPVLLEVIGPHHAKDEFSW
jgi:hypothetical protein